MATAFLNHYAYKNIPKISLGLKSLINTWHSTLVCTKYEMVQKTLLPPVQYATTECIHPQQKFGKWKMSKEDFMKHMVTYLLENGSERATCLPEFSIFTPTTSAHLTK